jgi:hypothetical protein
MFTNKHVIIAMIVAPILAIMTYFAVDILVGEPPKSIVAGGKYPLVGRPNCRYRSGQCTLKNSDIQIDLNPVNTMQGLAIQLVANTPLQSAKIAVVNQSSGNTDPPPETMQQRTPDTWYYQFQGQYDIQDKLRLAVKIQDAWFYADVSLIFTMEQDSMAKDGN